MAQLLRHKKASQKLGVGRELYGVGLKPVYDTDPWTMLFIMQLTEGSLLSCEDVPATELLIADGVRMEVGCRCRPDQSFGGKIQKPNWHQRQQI